jgi:hypothetical protein
MEAAWRALPLSVQIDQTEPQPPGARRGRLHPALPGPHRDRPPGGGEQAVSVEDSAPAACTARAAWPSRRPSTLLSEPAIVAGLAKAMLDPNPKVDWDAWVADYSKIRDAIAETYPEIFHDFNARMWTPGGIALRQRQQSTCGKIDSCATLAGTCNAC